MSITKNIISRTIGAEEDICQIFIQNQIVDPIFPAKQAFAFEVPLYKTDGATFSFYSQSVDGISTNLNNSKNVTFTFTANTSSLSGSSVITHDIFKIRYDDFSDAQMSPSDLAKRLKVGEQAETPITTLKTQVSGLTPSYSVTFPKLVKQTGNYAESLFEDKCQYFIDTKFDFQKPVDKTYGRYVVYSATTSGMTAVEVSAPTGLTETLQTSGKPHTILSGLMSGITVHGAFFTYFVAPTKPDINVDNGQPAVLGSLPTFSPIFAFKNVADGDYYKLQVSYNVSDTSFTGATAIFKVDKQQGDPELVRTFSTPLTPNAPFIYRVGNTKEIVNIFGIKQNVTTWSEYAEATTANDGTWSLSGNVYHGYIGGPPVYPATLQITILSSQSNVDLGADSAQDEDIFSEISSPLGGSVGSTITTTTNPAGQYNFGFINGGSYTVTMTPPPPYATQVKTVNLSAATSVDFIAGILWGDTTVTLSDPYTFT
jgi:hypothetical protein